MLLEFKLRSVLKFLWWLIFCEHLVFFLDFQILISDHTSHSIIFGFMLCLQCLLCLSLDLNKEPRHLLLPLHSLGATAIGTKESPRASVPAFGQTKTYVNPGCFVWKDQFLFCSMNHKNHTGANKCNCISGIKKLNKTYWKLSFFLNQGICTFKFCNTLSLRLTPTKYLVCKSLPLTWVTVT